jgi:phosphoribosylformylglycinamidine cyclo-ligase
MLYQNAGVNIDTLNLVKKAIGREVAKTFPKPSQSRFGLFGGIYEMGDDYLVSSVDGVGTKILVACGMGVHRTIGMDLVNHCVDDILTTGARPVFFLDYIAFSEIEKKTLIDIVKGIAVSCRREQCPLVAGETAQMSRFYPKEVYDLVGFIVGRVAKKDYIDPGRIAPGDVILGLKSSGLHTNGYSLARKVLLKKYTFHSYARELKCTIGEELLKVHLSYRRGIEPRLKYVRGMAHITGGGFYDNIDRILPPGAAAVIRKKAWKPYPIFRLIQKMGAVPEEEMYRVFNMGIGMVVFVRSRDAARFRALEPVKLGEVVKGDFRVKLD